jgi:4-amino-4-deoxy-L-arabinose transferase-like glycosyltransferase
MRKSETSSFLDFKLPQILRLALFSIAVAYLVIYLWIVYNRIRYPFDLEWIEGAMVIQVQRLISGQGMFVAPSINYIPFYYTPLYFYFSALAALVFGIGLFPLRLVSFLASLVAFTMIFLIVRDETK